MSQVKKGQFVQVHYTGRLEDGSIFDSSEGRQPLEFQAGGGPVIPGFDQAVVGMTVNDEKKINIAVDDAYGSERGDFFAIVATALSGDVVSALERHRERGRHRTWETPRGTVHFEKGRYRTRTFTPRESSSCDHADTSSCNH